MQWSDVIVSAAGLGSTVNNSNLAALQHLANNTGSNAGLGGLHGLNTSPGTLKKPQTDYLMDIRCYALSVAIRVNAWIGIEWT